MIARIERPFRAMADVVLGRQRSPANDSGPHMVPYLRAANVKDGYLDLGDIKEMNFSPVEQLIFSLRPGDVLVTEGAGSLAAVGAAAVWNAEIDAPVCFQNTLLRLRPRGSTDPRFLAWWARHAYSSGLFASIAGGANIYHLSAERVRSLPAWIPPAAIQVGIANHLESETARVDSIVAAKRRVVELLEQRYRSQADLILARHEAPLVPIGRFMTHFSQGTSPQAENRPAEGEEWGLLKLSAVKKGRFIPSENKALPAEFAIDTSLAPKPGDVLVTRSNTPRYVGDACAVTTEPGQVLLCDLIYRFRLTTQLLPEFAVEVLLSSAARHHFSGLARGTSQSMVKLRGEDVKAMPIPIVDVETQRRIVTKLQAARTAVDRAIIALDRQNKLLSEHRQALITAAVTGQLDVSATAA